LAEQQIAADFHFGRYCDRAKLLSNQLNESADALCSNLHNTTSGCSQLARWDYGCYEEVQVSKVVCDFDMQQNF